MQRMLFVLVASFCLLMSSAGVNSFETHEMPAGLSTYVLCCGKDFNGFGFCENRLIMECGAVGGRRVRDCSKCEHADED
jgi:hypothetical protein